MRCFHFSRVKGTRFADLRRGQLAVDGGKFKEKVPEFVAAPRRNEKSEFEDETFGPSRIVRGKGDPLFGVSSGLAPASFARIKAIPPVSRAHVFIGSKFSWVAPWAS
jgi:hypothetical protein